MVAQRAPEAAPTPAWPTPGLDVRAVDVRQAGLRARVRLELQTAGARQKPSRGAGAVSGEESGPASVYMLLYITSDCEPAAAHRQELLRYTVQATLSQLLAAAQVH